MTRLRCLAAALTTLTALGGCAGGDDRDRVDRRDHERYQVTVRFPRPVDLERGDGVRLAAVGVGRVLDVDGREARIELRRIGAPLYRTTEILLRHGPKATFIVLVEHRQPRDLAGIPAGATVRGRLEGEQSP